MSGLSSRLSHSLVPDRFSSTFQWSCATSLSPLFFVYLYISTSYASFLVPLRAPPREPPHRASSIRLLPIPPVFLISFLSPIFTWTMPCTSLLYRSAYKIAVAFLSKERLQGSSLDKMGGYGSLWNNFIALLRVYDTYLILM